MEDLTGASGFAQDGGSAMLAMDEEVGARIRRLRTAKGLSLKTVSERSGLSIGMLSLVERGRSSPSVRLLARLANALEVTVAHFIPGDQPSGTRELPILRAAHRPEISIWREGITKHVMTPGVRASMGSSSWK
jgi:Predicted transcriptional regulators